MPSYSYLTQQKKQKIMMWIFIAVLVITAAIIYFGFLKDKIKIGGVSIPVFNSETANIISENINVDFDVLDKKELKNLIPFEDAFPFKGKVGREEPFKPNL